MEASTLTVTTPSIREMAPARMAVVRTVGDPAVTGGDATRTLYASVPPGALRARWPNAHVAPKAEWIGIWALPLPAGVTPCAIPGMPPIAVESWEYGTVAEIVHVGPFATEMESVDRLHRFIADTGYEIAGPHEEEYLTAPGAPEQRTLIRYVIRKKG